MKIYGDVDINTGQVQGDVRVHSQTLILPEFIQDQIDQIPLLPVEAEWAPHGITILSCGIKLDADRAYSVVFEDWTGDPMAFSADIKTVATGAGDSNKTEAAVNVDVAIDHAVFLDLPATSPGPITMNVWFTYRLKKS